MRTWDGVLNKLRGVLAHRRQAATATVDNSENPSEMTSSVIDAVVVTRRDRAVKVLIKLGLVAVVGTGAFLGYDNLCNNGAITESALTQLGVITPLPQTAMVSVKKPATPNKKIKEIPAAKGKGDKPPILERAYGLSPFIDTSKLSKQLESDPEATASLLGGLPDIPKVAAGAVPTPHVSKVPQPPTPPPPSYDSGNYNGNGQRESKKEVVQGIAQGANGTIAIMQDGSMLQVGDTYEGDRRITFIGGDGIKFDNGDSIKYDPKPTETKGIQGSAKRGRSKGSRRQPDDGD